MKTGVGRQMPYTAIGQLVTHATNGQGDVVKVIVVPAEESIPKDLDQAISTLGIKVRRFRLERCSGLWVVYGRVRHARSKGSEGAVGRAGS
jgi:hypothetical protein